MLKLLSMGKNTSYDEECLQSYGFMSSDILCFPSYNVEEEILIYLHCKLKDRYEIEKNLSINGCEANIYS